MSPQQAHAAVCSSPNNSDVTFSSLSGTILSDPDGPGTEHTYTDGDCGWGIACPTGYFVLVYNYTGDTAVNSDEVTVVEAGSNVVSFSGSKHQYGGVLLSSNRGRIVFSVSSDSGETRTGFAIHWQCMPQQCTVEDPKSNSTLVGELNTPKSFRISGKFLGPYRYAKWENCQWNIQCPNGSYVHLKVRGNTTNRDDVLYAVGSYNATLDHINSYRTRYYGYEPHPGFFSWSNTQMLIFRTKSAPLRRWLDVTYDCRPSRCSSVNTTGSSYTAANGTLQSDEDGKSSLTTYDRAELCSWTIQCPDASSAIALEVNGESQSSDAVYMRNENMTFIRKFNGELANVKTLANLSTAAITFSSSSATDAERGWQLDWKCVPRRGLCLSPNSTSHSYPGALSAQTLMTDPGLDMTTYAGQQCKWRLTCPSSVAAGFMVLSFRPRAYRGSYGLSVYRPPYTLLVRAMYPSSSREQNLVLPYSAVDLLFYTTGQQAEASAWDLSFWCSPYSCTSESAGQILTESSGTIKSDSDGAGSGYYSNNERCQWIIHCPTNLPYLLIEYEGRMHSSYDKLVVTTARSGLKTVLTRSRSLKAFVNESNIKIDFETAPASGFSYAGFTMDYRCLPSRCSSVNNSGSVFSEPKGVIYSDEDGRGSRSVVKREHCQWTVQCPAGTYFAVTRAQVSLEDSDTEYIKFFDAKSKGTLLTLDGSHSKDSYVFPTGEVLIEFISAADSTSYGFTLHYECLPQQCYTKEDANATGPNVRNGKLLSDPDGRSSTHRQTSGQNCQWTVSCDPSGSDHLYMWVYPNDAYNSYSYEGGFYIKLDNGEWSQIDDTSEEPFDAGRPANAQIRYASALSSDNKGNGAELTYICSPQALCYSPTPSGSVLTDSSGTIKGDPDGQYSRYSTKVGGQTCDYTVSCPAGKGYSHVLFQARVTGSSDDNLYVTPGGSSKDFTFTDDSTDQGKVFALDSGDGSFRVEWRSEASNYTYRYGWYLRYTCLTSTCAAPYRSLSAEENGTKVNTLSLIDELEPSNTLFLSSDSDGPESSYLPAQDSYCTWKLQCPTADQRIVARVQGAMSYNKVNIGPMLLTGYFYNPASFFLLPSSSAVVEDRRPMTYSSYYGYKLYLACVDPAVSICPANSSTAYTALQSGTITSTGTKTSTTSSSCSTMYGCSGVKMDEQRYFAGSECEWNVACPSPATQSLSLRMRCHMTSADDVPRFIVEHQGKDIDVTPIMPNTMPYICGFNPRSAASSSTATTSLRWTIPEGKLKMQWKTDPWQFYDGTGGRGFRLEYNCVDKVEASSPKVLPPAEMCPRDEQYSFSIEGTLVTIVRAPAGAHCIWQLRCRASAKSIFVRAAPDSPESNITATIYDGETGRMLHQFWQEGGASFAGVTFVSLELYPYGASFRHPIELTVSCLDWALTSEAIPLDKMDASYPTLPTQMDLYLGRNHEISEVSLQVDHTMVVVCPARYVVYLYDWSWGYLRTDTEVGETVTIYDWGTNNTIWPLPFQYYTTQTYSRDGLGSRVFGNAVAFRYTINSTTYRSVGFRPTVQCRRASQVYRSSSSNPLIGSAARVLAGVACLLAWLMWSSG